VFLIPIVVYVILMSLGNDFAVFILSRVREEQKAFGFEEGLARAMVGSGAVVTGLGLILAVSLGSLGLVPFGYLEQLGITFVISLILDTFVIRIFYFPSMLLLLKGRQSEPVQGQGQASAST
jgi:RND superfamily putative drug exporter